MYNQEDIEAFLLDLESKLNDANRYIELIQTDIIKFRTLYLELLERNEKTKK